MVSKVTREIKVDVKAYFVGKQMHLNHLVDFFNYDITIENIGTDDVQLLQRHWLIKDSLNANEFVDGEGVVGKQPILKPNTNFQYTSGCFTYGSLGSMQGHYMFLNLKTQEIFQVLIPLFVLGNPNIYN